MDRNENLLDTPLDATTSSTGRHSGYTSSTLLKLDFGISVVLIGFSILASLAALFDAGIILIVMIISFFLGSYQLLSALIGGIRGNRKKLVYLVIALGYLFTFYGLFDVLEKRFSFTLDKMTVVIGLAIIPLALAIYYAKICYDLIKEQAIDD